MPFLFILLFLVLIIGGAIWSMIAANKRRDALRQFAVENNLMFYPDRDYSFDERYAFLNKLCQGHSRYAYNIIQGVYRQYPVILFDYHYATTSTDSKGRRKTNHHYFSFFILNVDNNFPELILAREGWFSKIAQWFGYDDIDFESAEFSRKFIVRSSDKKFAYDVFHARMIEYMLENEDLSIEIERNCVTLFFPHCLPPEHVEYNLGRLVEIREMFPGYLMGR